MKTKQNLCSSSKTSFAEASKYLNNSELVLSAAFLISRPGNAREPFAMYGLTENNCLLWHGDSYFTWEDSRYLDHAWEQDAQE